MSVRLSWLIVLFKCSVSFFFNVLYPYWFYVSSIIERGILESSTIKLWFCLFSFSFCFKHLETLLLGAYTFKIMSFWWIDNFVIVRCLPLPLVIFLVLKSLFDINVATAAFLSLVFALYIFFHPFILNVFVYLYIKWVSCR